MKSFSLCLCILNTPIDQNTTQNYQLLSITCVPKGCQPLTYMIKCRKNRNLCGFLFSGNLYSASCPIFSELSDAGRYTMPAQCLSLLWKPRNMSEPESFPHGGLQPHVLLFSLCMCRAAWGPCASQQSQHMICWCSVVVFLTHLTIKYPCLYRLITLCGVIYLYAENECVGSLLEWNDPLAN